MKKSIILGLLLLVSYKQIDASPLITRTIGILAVIGGAFNINSGLECKVNSYRNILLVAGIYGIWSGLYLINESYCSRDIRSINNSPTNNE